MAANKKNEHIVVMYRSSRSGTFHEGDLNGIRSKSSHWMGPYRCRVTTLPDGNQTVEVMDVAPEKNDALSAGLADEPEVDLDGENPDTSFC